MWDIGKIDDCLASYMVAHLLNRNHPLLTKELVKVLAVNGLEYNEWRFIPQIKLKQQDSTNMSVAYANGWEGYAIAKAVWAFEPNHSETMGEVFGAPSMVQEKEALIKQIEEIFADHVARINDLFDERALEFDRLRDQLLTNHAFLKRFQ